MFKQVNGFLNKTKTGEVSIVTSIYNGEDANKEIQENVVTSLENFGFKKMDGKNDAWLQYRIACNGNSKEEKSSLSEIITNKERVRVLLNKEGDNVSILEATGIKNTDIMVHVKKAEEKESVFYGYMNILKDDNSEIYAIGLNTSVKTSAEESDNLISYVTTLGFKESNSTNDEYKNFSYWINKPSDYEKEMLKDVENGRYKYTVNVVSYGANISRIASIRSIEEVGEKPNVEEASALNEEADF